MIRSGDTEAVKRARSEWSTCRKFDQAKKREEKAAARRLRDRQVPATARQVVRAMEIRTELKLPPLDPDTPLTAEWAGDLIALARRANEKRDSTQVPAGPTQVVRATLSAPSDSTLQNRQNASFGKAIEKRLEPSSAPPVDPIADSNAFCRSVPARVFDEAASVSLTDHALRFFPELSHSKPLALAIDPTDAAASDKFWDEILELSIESLKAHARETKELLTYLLENPDAPHSIRARESVDYAVLCLEEALKRKEHGPSQNSGEVGGPINHAQRYFPDLFRRRPLALAIDPEDMKARDTLWNQLRELSIEQLRAHARETAEVALYLEARRGPQHIIKAWKAAMLAYSYITQALRQKEPDPSPPASSGASSVNRGHSLQRKRQRSDNSW
jgi:hypothetical protein